MGKSYKPPRYSRRWCSRWATRAGTAYLRGPIHPDPRTAATPSRVPPRKKACVLLAARGVANTGRRLPISNKPQKTETNITHPWSPRHASPARGHTHSNRERCHRMVLGRCNPTRLSGVYCRQGWRLGALCARGAAGASAGRMLRSVSKVLGCAKRLCRLQAQPAGVGVVVVTCLGEAKEQPLVAVSRQKLYSAVVQRSWRCCTCTLLRKSHLPLRLRCARPSSIGYRRRTGWSFPSSPDSAHRVVQFVSREGRTA